MNHDPYDTAREAQNRAAKRLQRRRRRSAPEARADGAAPVGLAAGSVTQIQGHAAEQRASRFLEAQGLRILAANLHCRAGEIDLIAWDASTLVFVEVRQRTSRAYGGAAASVNRRKQLRLIRAARYFLPKIARRSGSDQPPACRFDVVALDGGRLTWIRDAFDRDPE
jgi:putative endonuclease